MGVFEKKSEFPFLPKTPKTVLLITQQPNIMCHAYSVANDEEKGWTQSCSGCKKQFSEKKNHTTSSVIPCT